MKKIKFNFKKIGLVGLTFVSLTAATLTPIYISKVSGSNNKGTENLLSLIDEKEVKKDFLGLATKVEQDNPENYGEIFSSFEIDLLNESMDKAFFELSNLNNTNELVNLLKSSNFLIENELIQKK